jgi:hypothetical protein
MPRKEKQITPVDGGFFRDIAIQIKLILRLIADPRVNPLLKLLPIGSLIYLVFPDLAPGPIDDALIIGIGTYLFVELCPPHVVQEHKDALQRVVPGQWKNPESKNIEIDEADIVDGEFREKEEKN